MGRLLARASAELVLLVHALFVGFAVIGALGWLWSPVVPWLHLPVLAWAAGINLASWTCPLTPLENRLRVAAGQSGYAGGCIQHYLERLGIAAADQRWLELRVGVAILVWNAVLYLLVWLLLQR